MWLTPACTRRQCIAGAQEFAAPAAPALAPATTARSASIEALSGHTIGLRCQTNVRFEDQPAQRYGSCAAQGA